MTRLIVDAIRRKKFPILLWTFQVSLMSRSVWSRSGWLDEIAASLVVAMFFAMPISQWFSEREISQLPISRRTFWLAQWSLSVPLVSLLMVSAVQFALWSNRPSEWSWGGTAMTLLYCVLYTGAFQAVFTTAFGRRADEPATAKNVGGWAVFTMGATLAPAAFGPYLPHRPEQVGPVTGVLLIAALWLTVRGFRHQPPIIARLSRRTPQIPQGTPAQRRVEPEILTDAEKTLREERLRKLPLWIRALLFVLDIRPDEKKRGVADYLEGFRLLVWLEGRRDLIACIVTVTFLAFVRMFGLIHEKGLVPWRRFAESLGFLPFLHASGTLADVMVIGVFGFFASAATHARVDNLRLLRSLPLSASRLLARVAVLGAVSGAAVWFVLFFLHFLSSFSLPVSLRLDVFVAATALMTFVSAVRLGTLGTQVPLPLTQAIGIGLPCTLWYAAFTRPLASPAFSMALASLVVLVLAYAVLLVAITRSSRIYRPAPAAIPVQFQ